MIKNLLFVLVALISFTVEAQDQRLISNTWYLTSLQINGTNYSPPSTSIIPEIQFNISNTGLYQTEVCSGTAIVGQATFIGTNTFEVTSQAQALGTCSSPDPNVDAILQNFNALHNAFLIFPGQQGLISTYTMQPILSALNLTITNTNGDVATYNNMLTASLEEHGTRNFKIYPNPGSEIIKLQFSDGQIATKLMIYDMAGRDVMLVTKSPDSLNVSRLDNGMYLLIVIFEDGSSSLQRFVKQ